MILLFKHFNTLLEKLKALKQLHQINKYFIHINQRNEIDVLLITDHKNVLEGQDFTFNLTVLSEAELEEDYFYQNLFAQNGDEIIDYQNSRRKLTNLFDVKSTYEPPIPVITYYSYKGGMGRSTNLVLTATHLARFFNQKIVIIDFDFEAPGFSNFFLEEPASSRYQNGVVEYFFDSERDNEINLTNYSWEVSKEFSKDGEIRIIPAGNLEFEINLDNAEFSTHLLQYLEGLSRLDFSSTDFIIKKFQNLLNEIKRQFNPDIVLIDSRTGFTDIFGIAALHLSSHVVGFFSNSVQNEAGMHQFLKNIIKISNQKSEFRTILVNAFSDSDFFDAFKQKADTYIQNMAQFNDKKEDNAYLFSPEYFYFRYNITLAEIGTTRERKKNWLEQVDEKSFSKGYVDLAEKIFEFTHEYNLVKNVKSDPQNQAISESNEIHNFDFPNIQRIILTNLQNNYPNLYADDANIDFNEEYKKGNFFYRDFMKDIFNFDKFMILGNKGTGKSYLFQSLKNLQIVEELKKRAQKTHLNVKFLHLVDKKDNYFISTKDFESFEQQIVNIGDFYAKFWKVYTWRTMLDRIKGIIDFSSNIPLTFNIEANSTETIKQLIEFVANVDNLILVEKELFEIDKYLNINKIDIIVIYDNLDLMVEPLDWKNQMAALINFWNFSNYKRIHTKLFLRSDLYKKISGINNVQSLNNKITSIEWNKQEIFNYFFNLVKLNAKDEFMRVVERFDFNKISADVHNWVSIFKKGFEDTQQKNFEESGLKRLCWVFFGQYPSQKSQGESYNWLYKNLMNADETISLRPFIDLLKLAINLYMQDENKVILPQDAILPRQYYTAKEVRIKAVNNHFNDLAREKGNENLMKIFEAIEKNDNFKYYSFLQKDFKKMLTQIKKEYVIQDTIQDIENLLIINGIVNRTPIGGNVKYDFAFLYRHRLGLRGRK